MDIWFKYSKGKLYYEDYLLRESDEFVFHMDSSFHGKFFNEGEVYPFSTDTREIVLSENDKTCTIVPPIDFKIKQPKRTTMDTEVKYVIRGEDGYYTQTSDGYISNAQGQSARNAVSYSSYSEAERALMALQIGGTFTIEKVYINK